MLYQHLILVTNNAGNGHVGDTIERLRNQELIYHLKKDSWGKGLGSEAAKACLEMAKNHGAVKRIFASADAQNKNSLKILEKIGFTYCGLKWFEDTNQEEPYYEYII